MKIALAQIDVFWEDKGKNKLTCSKFISKAKENNCSMIIFPEMTLTGFSMNTKIISELQKNSDTLDFFINEAKSKEINIVFGYVENTEENYFNKCIVVNSQGDIISTYDKIHPFSYDEEDKHFSSGKKLSYFQIDNITFSTFICYDLRFPEIFQLASNHSDVIIVIANWPKTRISHWETLLKARAIETQSYILGVNRVGNGNGLIYNGCSMIVDPNGDIINSSINDETLIIGEIDVNSVSNARENFKYKQDRKTTLYQLLNKEETMKSSDTELIERGYITSTDFQNYKTLSAVDCLKLLESDKAFERSIAAKLLRNNTIDKDLAKILCNTLEKETKLYTKIELCNTLSQSNIEGVSIMLEYLGKIGDNQYKILPTKLFNKKSYPLPRDIIARTLAHMDSKILPTLIQALKTCDLNIARELIDAIGFISFYTSWDYKEEVFRELLIYLEKHNGDNIIRWKIVRALSAFSSSISVDTLLAFKDSDKEEAIRSEAKRSLNIIKMREENKLLKREIKIEKEENDSGKN